MRCDLEWFRTFKIIYEVGTMSEAARELGVSQPGVSLQLSALESYIGQPLFRAYSSQANTLRESQYSVCPNLYCCK